MDTSNSKQTNPLQNLFVDVKKILDFMVIKDLKAATECETTETRYLGLAWMDAITHRDTYITYKRLWTQDMFQRVVNSVSNAEFNFYLEHPDRVPLKFRDTLLELGRQSFIESYVEKNNYYRMLIGLPDYDDTDFIYLSEELQEKYGVSADTPVHELDEYTQRRYMGTSEYSQVLSNNPDKKYLLYLGSQKIDLYTARNAKDFEIIRYPSNRSDINPNLLSRFAQLYSDYREYVMVVLYNTQFETFIDHYRTFMGTLILEYTLYQLGNAALEATNNRNYLDDTIVYTTLSMYGIPDSLLMTKQARRDLAIHILKIVKEKGTSDVYYDIINILGYEDVAISKLMLMKGQQFDHITGQALDESEPYFLQLDIKDNDPYSTITSGNAPILKYQDVISGDPTWWDTPDVQKLLKDSNYSMTESKYIVIESTIHQMQHMFELLYFTRMLLDNKNQIEDFEIEIPELFGSTMIPIYDIMLYLIGALCMETDSEGKFVSDTPLQAIAGFNFDIQMDSFKEFLNTTSYVDTDRLMKFLNAVNISSQDDIQRVFNEVLVPLREWLEKKVVNAGNKQEFIEYESIYQALFSYDIMKNSVVDDMNFKPPIETICELYGITDEQMKAYQHYYPREMTGEAITDSTFDESRYATSLKFSRENSIITWKLNVSVSVSGHSNDERGWLYLHDILNYHDCRYIPIKRVVKGNVVEEGRFFMDYVGDDGWKVNQSVVNQVIKLIERLSDDELNDAYFVVDTPVLNSNGKWYNSGTKLVKISPVFKDILITKLKMDMDGLADPADNYFELLRRRNLPLYKLLCDPTTNRYEYNKESWMNDVMTITLALETSLSMHMKYFEQSILGKDLYFKPLITLINHFKSMMVQVVKTGVKYIFDSKMDLTGTSNMFRLFDDASATIRFTTLANSGFTSEFGLYDAISSTKRQMIIRDRTELIKETIGQGFAAKTRTRHDGSIRMVDEAKFFKNGKPIDPNGHAPVWFSGEPGTGRWSEEDDILFKTRTSTERIKNINIDYDGWQEFVESNTPV